MRLTSSVPGRNPAAANVRCVSRGARRGIRQKFFQDRIHFK
jgi:hypothetical protein